MSIERNGKTYRTWEDVEKEIFTPEEIAESDQRAARIGELIKARQEKEMSREKLEFEEHDLIDE